MEAHRVVGACSAYMICSSCLPDDCLSSLQLCHGALLMGKVHTLACCSNRCCKGFAMSGGCEVGALTDALCSNGSSLSLLDADVRLLVATIIMRMMTLMVWWCRQAVMLRHRRSTSWRPS